MNLWWKKGWEVNFQNIHWQEGGVWCQGLYWPHPQSKTCVILMHGSMANAHWWRAIAGYLAQDFQVFAPHFSGMGESDWRDTYSVRGHALEVKRALDVLECDQFISVGHSYGGYCGLMLANFAIKQHVAHVLVDSPLAPLLHPASRSKRLKGRVNYYESFESISKRFRLVPNQPMPEQNIVDDIISQSVIQDDQGWRWRFDPSSMSGLAYEQIDCKAISLPIHYISAKQSAFYEHGLQEQTAQLGWHYSEIEQAYHATMLDQPQLLYAQIDEFVKARV